MASELLWTVKMIIGMVTMLVFTLVLPDLIREIAHWISTKWKILLALIHVLNARRVLRRYPEDDPELPEHFNEAIRQLKKQLFSWRSREE